MGQIVNALIFLSELYTCQYLTEDSKECQQEYVNVVTKTKNCILNLQSTFENRENFLICGSPPLVYLELEPRIENQTAGF